MPLMAMSVAWIDRDACSDRECARLRISRCPWARAALRKSTAFQKARPSTHALITATTRVTVAMAA